MWYDHDDTFAGSTFDETTQTITWFTTEPPNPSLAKALSAACQPFRSDIKLVDYSEQDLRRVAIELIDQFPYCSGKPFAVAGCFPDQDSNRVLVEIDGDVQAANLAFTSTAAWDGIVEIVDSLEHR